MKMRSVLCTTTAAAALAIIPAGAALAQPGQPSGSLAQAARANASALRAGQRISLARLHLVGGIVRDMRGRGLAGVCVLAVGPGGVARLVRTSASGRYEISLPRAGGYTVQYRDCSPGRASVAVTATRQVQVGTSPLTALPATIVRQPGTAGGEEVSATAGVITPNARHIILAAPGEVIDNGRAQQQSAKSTSAAVITGRVTAPSGRPLARICMSIVGKTFAAGTSTNKHGTYRFEVEGGGIAGHKYPVEFDSNCNTADPFGPVAPGRWAPEWYKDTFSSSTATGVPVRAGKTIRGIDAVMQRGGEVSGAISGSDHRGLKNACAVLTNSAGDEFGQAFTNAKGDYTITGLDPGRYRLLGIADCKGGQSDYAQMWYPHATSLEKARVLKVRLGHRTTGINVVLKQLGTVTGSVRLGGSTGRPLRGICVSVFSPTNPSAGGYVTSGKNGRYVVQGLPAGRYEAQADASCSNNGNYTPAQYPHAVHVADGVTTAGINLYMHTGGILTGTVTDAATAQPLPGICVYDGNGDFAVSGKNGIYKIDQLPSERTTVDFNGGCGNIGSYAPQYYDNQVAQEGARVVTVTAGRVTSGISAAMLPGGTIAGRVTDSAGQPVSRVCIAIVPPGYLSAFGLDLGGNTWTNAKGSYEVANLAPGDYAVAFFSGCLGPSNAAVAQWFKGQQADATAGLVDASAGADVSGIDAMVGRAGAIAGTVTNASGRLIDFDCVTAIKRRTGQPSGFQSLMGSGTYTVSSLAPGRYTVIASDCYLGSNLGPAIYRREVTVRAGMTTKKVALTLQPGGSVDGRIVTASNGKPVPDACVEAIPVRATAASLTFAGAALTGSTGMYKITGLHAGSYRIEIDPSCAGPAVNLQPVTLPHPVRLARAKVTAGVNAALHAGGSIAGLVTAPGAGDEPGACVEAYQLPGGLAAATTADAHGKYVVTGLVPGSYKVQFGDPSCSDSPPDLGTEWYNGTAGRGSATVITVTAGRTASSINGSLPADGTITGSVTGSSAAPLTGACVSAVPVTKGEMAVFTVSADGTYTLADLLPGRYRVEFQAGCGQAGVKTQWWQGATSGAAATIIAIKPGVTVSGIDAVLTTT